MLTGISSVLGEFAAATGLSRRYKSFIKGVLWLFKSVSVIRQK